MRPSFCSGTRGIPQSDKFLYGLLGYGVKSFYYKGGDGTLAVYKSFKKVLSGLSITNWGVHLKVHSGDNAVGWRNILTLVFVVSNFL